MTTGTQSILVMDDSAFVLDALRTVLESEGYDVHTAASLADLERELQGGKPDIFVLDVQMPEMFGEQVAEVLREVRHYEVPILLYSSVEEAALAARAKDAGVGYVHKRAGTGALVRRIQSILGEPKGEKPS